MFTLYIISLKLRVHVYQIWMNTFKTSAEIQTQIRDSIRFIST